MNQSHEYPLTMDSDIGQVLQQRWHGWGSPVGLGLGLVCIGGFFALVALGLNLLAATPY
jgi:hypothetical protein